MPDRIHAAYNFVPLSNSVFLPDWARQVSHDMPMADAYSGTLNLTLKSHSPILPGEQRDQWTEHFQLPDGYLAIPGSSLRGMIRSVLEIASFGKMRLVDDRRLGVRDLLQPFYKNAFTEKGPGHQHYKPKVKTGWLRYQDNKWILTPCRHARIEQSMIRETLKKDHKVWVSTERNQDLPTADKKYQKWLAAGQSLKTRFTPGKEDYQHHSRGKRLYYQPVRALGSTEEEDGYLIFTGQPGPGKHMEFIFYDDSSTEKKIDAKVIRDFQHIYDSEQDQKHKKQGHYHYLQTLDFDGKGMPVFYLVDEKTNRVNAIGLSQMFKLAYDNSIGDLIDQCDQRHRANNAFDLAELIFGTVDEVDGKGSLKGRVSFAHARSEKPAKDYDTQAHTTILNSPKPSYYPNYIVQQEQDGKLQTRQEQYQTFMDNTAEIRGWKRYPVRPTADITEPEAGQGESVQSKLKPVTEPVSYTGKLRFHNLNKEELGAVLWAMTWGNDKKLRHAVGMGKPFGLGQISIHVDWNASTVIANQPGHPVPEFASVLDAFTRMMGEEISNWQDSDQINQLLAMADPTQAKGKNLNHMSLNGVGGGNEFVLAKGGHENDKLVLEKYTLSGKVAKQRITEEQEWLDNTVEALKQQNHAETRAVMLGKGLASAWQQIDAADLQAKVLSLIQIFWEKHNGWHGPHVGKARKTAYKTYIDNSDSN